MNPIVTAMLQDGEKFCEKVGGRLERLGRFGGPLFPAQAYLLATNRRILYVTKVHGGEITKEAEILYENVTKFSVYRDIMMGLTGLIAKTLHLQDNQGNVIRLIGPHDYEPFCRFVQDRIPVKAKISPDR